MRSYDTVSEAVNDLIQRGYTHDFNVQRDSLFCAKKNIQLQPEEFEIDEFYRFEGQSDPGDMMIVYAISSPVHDLKGVLVNAFGTYSDTLPSKLIAKLKVH